MAEFSLFCSKCSLLDILLISSRLKDIREDILGFLKEPVLFHHVSWASWLFHPLHSTIAAETWNFLPSSASPSLETIASHLLPSLTLSLCFPSASYQPMWKTSLLAAVPQHSSALTACHPSPPNVINVLLQFYFRSLHYFYVSYSMCFSVTSCPVWKPWDYCLLIPFLSDLKAEDCCP